MEYYNDKLKELKEQAARKTRLTNMVKDLRKQREALQEKVRDLEYEKISEQEDVKRLECRSLANFFYSVVGRKDAMLTKEKEEAYAAAVKYDAAVSELEAVRADIRKLEAQMSELYGVEKKYAEAMEEKRRLLKESGTPQAQEILRLEEEAQTLNSNEKEIKEAISAGNTALFTVEKILKSLESASGWGTWDILGGGLIADVAKHSHLDEAQDNVQKLQIQLRRFKTELADVSIRSDIQINVDGFLRFADYFFDGLFADWTVLSRIENSMEQANKTHQEIKTVLRRLEGVLHANNQEQTRVKVQLERLIGDASV